MSPGSVAETVHGRRGGGWLPKETVAPDLPPKPKNDPAKTLCSICLAHDLRVTYADHPTDTCGACGGHPHHDPQVAALCWVGRARMAAAKRDRLVVLGDRATTWAGVPHRFPLTDAEQDDLDAGLTEVELNALARHPDPHRLTPDGYVDAGFWKKATG